MSTLKDISDKTECFKPLTMMPLKIKFPLFEKHSPVNSNAVNNATDS